MVVYAVAFVQSCFGIFNEPAENSLLPLLVERERLVAANSLNALNNNAARLVGPALAGLVVGWFGLVGVVVLDAASFLVAALLVSLISASAKPEREIEQSTDTANLSLHTPIAEGRRPDTSPDKPSGSGTSYAPSPGPR